MQVDALIAVRKKVWLDALWLALFVTLFLFAPDISAAIPNGVRHSDFSLSCEQIVRLANWGVSNSRHAGGVNLADHAFAKKALERFVEKADPFRLLLTQKQVEQFQALGLKAWEAFLASRDCGFFERWIQQQYPPLRQKLAARADLVAKKTALLNIIPKGEESQKPKAYTAFAKTEGELEGRLAEWAKHILSTSTTDLLRAYRNNKEELIRDSIFQGLFDGQLASRNWLAKAVLETLDPYSTYFSPAEFEDFYSDLSGGISGVGLRIRKVPEGLLVEKILADSPAAKARELKEGDVIVKVNGEVTTEMDQAKARRALQGPEGSLVRLEARSGFTGKKYTETIRRKRFRFDESRLTYFSRKTGTGKNVAVIEVPSFYGRGGMDDAADERSTTEDFKAVLKAILRSNQQPSALVLDLRGNPGGYLEEAVSLAGVFVGTKPVVSVVEKDGKRILREEHVDATYSGPVAVLVDENTASASEVFAGALKDYQRALVLSESPTFGKGSVQRLFHLDDPFLHAGFGATLGHGVVKLTTSVFYSPLGFTPANGGITPHLQLPAMNPDSSEEGATGRVRENLPLGEPLITGQELVQAKAREAVMNGLVADLRVRLKGYSRTQLRQRKSTEEDADLNLTLSVIDDYLSLAQSSALLNPSENNLVRK